MPLVYNTLHTMRLVVDKKGFIEPNYDNEVVQLSHISYPFSLWILKTQFSRRRKFFLIRMAAIHIFSLEQTLGNLELNRVY